MEDDRSIKSATTKELAGMYNVSCKTFRNWIRPFKKEIGKRQGRYYNARQIYIIFLRLGAPFALLPVFNG